MGIVLRTAHLGAMAVLFGGLFFSASGASLREWQILTAVTGLALLLSEMSHSRHWVYQGCGLICIAHVLLAGLASSGKSRDLALAALIIGSIGSHLPRAVRRWSLRHWRVID